MRLILVGLILCTLNFCEENEDFSDFLDLELHEKGTSLFQTAPDSTGKQFFLLKQIFPSGTSTVITNNLHSPSILSTRDGTQQDNKYKLFATLGQVIAGSSEDTANFRLKSGFFTSSRKSVYRIRGIRTRRQPISIQRDF